VLIGGTGTGKSHLAIAIARACIRSGARGRFYTVVDLVLVVMSALGVRRDKAALSSGCKPHPARRLRGHGMSDAGDADDLRS
jgi:DNA replication protein DnaC